MSSNRGVVRGVIMPEPTSENGRELGTYAIFSDNRALTDLAAERRVSEINGRVDRQRQLVEQLAAEGHDITSAKIVLDSLIISLFLAAEDRHRLRAMICSDG